MTGLVKRVLICVTAGLLLLAPMAGAESDVPAAPTQTAPSQSTEKPADVPAAPAEVAQPEPTEELEDTPAAPAEAAQPEPTEEPANAPKPAKGYVLVTTDTQSGWLPLPEEGEVSYPLRQLLPNGAEAVNTIHLTPDGVYMEDSTCEGHDCVQQGEVTLDNRQERILGNMIICLPNQVTLQLYTPEELLELMKWQ